MITPEQFIDECRKWVGTPFKHRGRAIGKGVDCIGVPYTVGIRNGLFEPSDDAVSYSRDPDGIKLQEYLDKYCVKIHNKQMQPGDILLFRFLKHPQHIGVYTGRNLIHAYSRVGKCIEHGFDDKWRRLLVAVYRIKAFADVS